MRAHRRKASQLKQRIEAGECVTVAEIKEARELWQRELSLIIKNNTTKSAVQLLNKDVSDEI